MRPSLICRLGLAGALAVTTTAVALASQPSPLHPLATVAQRFAAADTALPESLAFLEFVSICPAHVGCSRPICPSDSIRVSLAGAFPSDCYSLHGIDLYWPPVVPVGGGVGLRPLAPWVRVIVDDGACLGRPCVGGPHPWSGAITLPPLPEGLYPLEIALIREHCPSDSIPPPPWTLRPYAFEVAPCDTSTAPACFAHAWEGPVQPRHLGCDVTIAPDEPAVLTLDVRSPVPLAGIQGDLRLEPRGLHVLDLRPVGAAAGMRVTWAASDSGARFVMFADSAAIPATPTIAGLPVLAVTVAVPPGAQAPALTTLATANLLGADPEGNAVPPCDSVLYSPPARICAAPDCDFNHDGATDVRDLVLMVNCLHQPTACTLFDCNGDGVATLDDVLCCAWNILRHPPCATCGPDSTPRKDSAVRVVVGVPVATADGVSVPIHIDAADHVGAARLAMSFPADRWRIAGLDASDATWLTLADVENGQAVMGAIRISDPHGPATLDLTLRLQPLTGKASGGELGSLQTDVSGTDGVKLLGTVDGPARPLPGGLTAELSANRPEPFSDATRFTLSLPAPARVDLAVFDVNGRRVATLSQGVVPAGVTEYTWSGRTSRGDRANGGVYFYRATIDGHAMSRRMVYLGGR